MKSVKLNTWDALSHRLLVIGIPRHLIPGFLDIWFRWVTHNGPEWAVKRFKSLKVDLIRQHGGLPLVSTWIRKNSRGQYYGTIGALFRWAKIGEKQFSRVLQAFCIYTSMLSKVETESQLKKFIDAVSCSLPIGLTSTDLSEIMNTASSLIGYHTISRCDNRLITYRGSPDKLAPLPHNLGCTQQDKNILLETTWLRNPDNTLFYLDFRDLYDPVLDGIGNITSSLFLEVDRTSYAGEVHFIQEPGYKLRSIASPYRIHQLALQPLGNALGGIVSKLPWDCTFDQSKALPVIQDYLRDCRPVYSVDLSSATDYFPLLLQENVLRSIFGPSSRDVDLFCAISKMKWKSSIGDVQWKRGQPLGVYPSFFAFTLTHGIILAWLAEMQTDKFFVLGDDVVILDTQLYERYINFLMKINCPYSVEKSISSALVAEFAGQVVTPDRTIPQLKWRKVSNDNFLDICRLLGRDARSLLSDRQKKVFDAVMHLLPPIGLNMSKPNSDFLSAFRDTESFLSKVQQSAVRSLVDLIRPSWNKSMEDPQCHTLCVNTDTFDEKVLMVFQKTVFSHWKWLEHVSDLPQALGLEPRLPIWSSPRRYSTLLRYERILAK